LNVYKFFFSSNNYFISKNENKVVVRGKEEFVYIQKSLKCNKEKDPECDDMIYGNCAEADYSAKTVSDVELVFVK
jgi:hypothetical protein